MNVLYIIGGEGRRHGSEIIAIDLLSAGRRNGINYIVVTANRGAVYDACIELKLPCYVIPFTFYVYKELPNRFLDYVKKTVWKTRADYLTKRAAKKIKNIIDMSSVDVIHTNLSRDLLGGVLSEQYNIPHVWHIQELFNAHYQLSFLKENQMAWMASHADEYMAISKTVAEQWVENGLPKEKVRVVYNGVDFSKIIPKTDYSHDLSLHLVMVGHIVPAKGQEKIVKCLCKLPNEVRKHVSFDCFGEGEKEYLSKIATIAEKGDVLLNYRGYCADIGAVLKDYDIGINCSKGEGFGLSTVEFMAAGLCPVVSDTGANTELIEDGKNGFIFDINSVEDFLSIIIRLFNNRELLFDTGKAARVFALANFEIDKMQDNVLSIYRSIIKNNID